MRILAKIIEIATKVGKGAVKDITLFMKHSIDIDSFLVWFETRMKTASVEISHQRLFEDENNNIRTHSYNKTRFWKNRSVFHKTILESILQEMLNKPLENISVTPTMLSFSFDE